MKHREIVHDVMGAHKRGKLRASNGAPVKERRRAVAIALSMAERVNEPAADHPPSPAVSKLLEDLKADNAELAAKVHRASDRQLELPGFRP